MKVLLNTVFLGKKGGVATYSRIIRPHYSSCSVKYFTVGSRNYTLSPLNALSRLFADYKNFYKEVHTNHFDIVHLNPSLGYKAIIRDALFLVMAKQHDCKTIVFIHGWDENFERVLRRHFLFLFQKAYFKADAFIVLSSTFKDRLIQMGYDKSIFVETTAVSQDIFDQHMVSEKCFTEKQFNILFLARLHKEKGIYETLDAYHILKRKFPFVALNVAGDGPELKAAKTYATKNGIRNVTFCGYLQGSNKWAAFRDADVYIFPSYSEGMPISVLEAMAFGLPIITRPVGGIPDFFEIGKMGYLTESKDPNVYAQLMEKFIVDRALGIRMGGYNREYAREHFAAQSVAKRIENIYKEVLFG